jgi:hypothetical protein
MSSERQIEANQLNAQRSTGPRSPDGKARVASNALKHGLTGKRVVLPNENAEEFEAFRIALWNDLDPQGALEESLAENIVANAWRLKRVPMLEGALYARDLQEHIVKEIERASSTLADYGQSPKLKEEKLKLEQPALRVTYALEKHAAGFASLWRHEEVLARSMLRTLHELQRLQAMRAGEPVVAPAVLDVNINYDSPENCES